MFEIELKSRSTLAPTLPRHLYIEVTNHCNSLCISCPLTYDHFLPIEPKQHLSWENFRRIVDPLPTLERVVLHGIGEPLLNRDLPRFISHLKERGAYVLFNSNGVLLDQKRGDALVAAARVIERVDALMRARGEDGRGTVGFLQVLPASRNVVPGEVRFSVEFRHPSDAQIQGLSESFPEDARKLVEANGCKLELTELFRIPAQPFDASCVDLVRQAAKRLGLPSREIISGAGHDAVYVARSVPTAMIFTPCKDGLSHNEAESIMPEEAEAGCQVLFEAVVARANRAL
jgi:organic radical activating enzyme